MRTSSLPFCTKHVSRLALETRQDMVIQENVGRWRRVNFWIPVSPLQHLRAGEEQTNNRVLLAFGFASRPSEREKETRRRGGGGSHRELSMPATFPRVPPTYTHTWCFEKTAQQQRLGYVCTRSTNPGFMHGEDRSHCSTRTKKVACSADDGNAPGQYKLPGSFHVLLGYRTNTLHQPHAVFNRARGTATLGGSFHWLGKNNG